MKELFKWVLFVLFIGALLVVGYAFGPTVFQWVQQTRATANAPVVEPIQDQQQPLVSADVTVSSKVEDAEPVLSADVLLLPESEYDQKVAYCKGFAATFGKTGSFFGEFDSNMNTCVIGMWEGSRISGISEGMALSELKEQGDDYSFLLPFSGVINHSANTIYVNGIKCTPGNPVSCEGVTIFEKNTPIHIISDPGNDSSGVMLIQNP